ncbi:MAG: peptide-binding protein [Candidatus Parcubacteria bacterium]|nr:MAG: peptide-binding protein [Candidatus Parcubacteria bacterium]
MERTIKFILRQWYTKQLFFKNVFWLYFAEVASKGVRLFVFLFISRYLGPTEFGVFEYFFSFVGLFFLFSDLGISNIFIRDYNQNDDQKKLTLISEVFTLKLYLSIIFALLALGGYLFTKNIGNIYIYIIFVLFYFFQNLENYFESYFVAKQMSQKRFIFNFISSLVLLVFIIVGLIIWKNILVVAMAYLLSMLTSLLIAYFLFWRETKIILNFSFPVTFLRLKYYIINGLPLALFGLLGFVFFATDRIFITHFLGPQMNGVYSVASRFVGVIQFIPSILTLAFFPILSFEVSRNNYKRLQTILFVFTVLLILIGLLSAVLMYLLSEELILFIFGYEFALSVPILKVFVWILIFLFPTNFLDYFLLSYNKQWLDFILTLFPALLNVILNIIFIPLFGVLGAVYASIIAQCLNFILTFLASFFVLKRYSLAR